jgi:hypothetical protein
MHDGRPLRLRGIHRRAVGRLGLQWPQHLLPRRSGKGRPMSALPPNVLQNFANEGNRANSNESCSLTPMCSAGWSRRPATKHIRASADCWLVVAAGKCAQRISTMRSPVVEWISAPIFQFVIVLTAILPQRFNASLTSIAIDPSPSKHATSNINTIQNVGMRYRDCFDT